LGEASVHGEKDSAYGNWNGTLAEEEDLQTILFGYSNVISELY